VGILAIIAGLASAGWAVPLYLWLSKNAPSVGDVFGAGKSNDWHSSWLVYSSIAQTVFGVLLLIGGILLMSRKGSGRVLTALSSIVIIGITAASVVIGYMYVKSMTDGEPEELKALVGNKLLFMMNPVFWWFDMDKMKAESSDSPFTFFDTLGHNFTIQLIALIVLAVVTVAALIGAVATKPAQQTAALATSPYGY
jgi:hypothetical protein